MIPYKVGLGKCTRVCIFVCECRRNGNTDIILEIVSDKDEYLCTYGD